MIHLNSQSNVIASYAMWRKWLGFGELLNRLLGEEEWYQSFDSLRSLFESMADDVDGHYLLSRIKFLAWLQKINDSGVEICNCLFPILDRDADNYISLNEFALGILCTFMEGRYHGPAPSAYNRARRQLLFLYYDVQGIGVWTRREWDLVVQDFMKYYHYNMMASRNVEACGRSVAICIESLQDNSVSNSKASSHLRRLDAFCVEERGIISFDAFYEACEQGLLSETFGVLSWQPRIASRESPSVDLNNAVRSLVHEGVRLTKMAAQTVPKIIETIWSRSNTLDNAIAASFLLTDPAITQLSPNRTGDACCGNEVTTIYSENVGTSSNQMDINYRLTEEQSNVSAISPSPCQDPDGHERILDTTHRHSTLQEPAPRQHSPEAQTTIEQSTQITIEENSLLQTTEEESGRDQSGRDQICGEDISAQQVRPSAELTESVEKPPDRTPTTGMRQPPSVEREKSQRLDQKSVHQNEAMSRSEVEERDAATTAAGIAKDGDDGSRYIGDHLEPSEMMRNVVESKGRQHRCGVRPLQHQVSICPSEDEKRNQQSDGAAMILCTTSASEDVDGLSVAGDGGGAFVYLEGLGGQEKINIEALDLGERVVRMYAKRCIGFVNGDQDPPLKDSQRFSVEVENVSRDLSFIARIVGQHFAKEDTLIDLNKVTGQEEFHVIGDLDGNVETLRAALRELFFAENVKKKSRLPQTTIIPSNITVIFAGNIVGGDDKPVSTDILWVLAGVWALKIMFPDKVFVLRGPNERNNKKIDQTITEVIGVPQGVVLWNQIYDVFEYTPIGALGNQWIWLFGGTLTSDMAEHLNEIRRMARPLVLEYIKNAPPLLEIIRDSYDATDVAKNAILRHYTRDESQVFPDIIVERQKVTMKITTNDLPLVLRVPIGGIPKLMNKALGATLLTLVT